MHCKLSRWTCWTLLAALVLVAAPAMAAPRGPRVAVSLEAERSSYGPSTSVDVIFALRNDGPGDVSVLAWKTPLRGFDADLFEVTRDGQPVAYLGKVVHWGEPTADDYLRVPAGEALDISFDLSSQYDMSAPGEYDVRFRSEDLGTQGVVVGGPTKVAPRDGVRVESNPLALQLVGERAAPVVPFAGTGDDLLKASTSFAACSSSQQSALGTARSNATSASSESYNHLVANQSAANSRYVTWFGAYDNSRYNTVKGNFLKIRDAFTNADITFHCDCTSSAYAYVYPSNPYHIWLCNAFWSAPAQGWDSKAGTLIHEMSHFTVVAGTDDVAYGRTACQRLAQKKPRSAIRNADSHEYYAENGM